MSRRARVWLSAALALAAVLTVMTLITRTLLNTERDAARARARAAQEEQVRLSLWRLDSTIPGRISQEMAQVALLAERPSEPPLDDPPGVRGRFVRDAEGTLRWLSVPDPPLFDALAERLHASTFDGALVNPLSLDLPPASDEVELPARAQGQGYYSDANQRARSTLEWSKRAANARDNLSSIASVQQKQTLSVLNSVSNEVENSADSEQVYRTLRGTLEQDRLPAGTAHAGPVTPLWIEGELVLARRVRRAEAVEIQGAWLDWPSLRDELEADIADLLPGGHLEPVPTPTAEDAGRLLATLPVRVVPGPFAELAPDDFSPVRASIVLGWSVVLVGTGVVIALLLWSWSLSERRAAFVSAVTHELRTPLTTFRMYTEMLGEKMVESKRDQYVATLRREAERLGHLVENVLAYARIEGRRTQSSQDLILDEVLDRFVPRLRERCAEANITLRVELAPDAAAARIRVDPTAVEQVLFNLVDNAAKYAPGGDQDEIVVEAVAEANRVRVAVRDYGPGIPPRERRKVFEPFAKSHRDEAGSKPGVGLGLALCRRLAEQLGGSLTLESANPGARFVLDLPRA